MRISLPAALIIALAACSGNGGSVDVGTHVLRFDKAGEGSPTVVIDVGIGSRSEDWAAIRAQVSLETTFVTYDRAGYGRSEMGPLPRDAGVVAEELHSLLEAASPPGPYILVGHSLGGLHMQIFAARYPDEVAGMVLLDPPPLGWIRGEAYSELHAMAEEMTAEWQGRADAGGDSADFFRTIASEHREMFGRSGDLAAEIASFGDIPLVVIASGRTNPMFGDIAEEYQQYWIEQSLLLSGKSNRGEFVLAEESSHMLHTDAEQLVVEQILSMVVETRGAAAARMRP
jgi:pimeloyl-ACP methyl ester carboxylesterase